MPCYSGSCSEIYLEKAFAGSLVPSERLPVAKELGETALMFLVHPDIVRGRHARNRPGSRQGPGRSRTLIPRPSNLSKSGLAVSPASTFVSKRLPDASYAENSD